MLASDYGHVDVVEALIKGKAHVDAADEVCVKVDFVIFVRQPKHDYNSNAISVHVTRTQNEYNSPFGLQVYTTTLMRIKNGARKWQETKTVSYLV